VTLNDAVASDPNSSAAAIRDHNKGTPGIADTLTVTNSVIENSQNGIQTQGSGNKENVTIKNDNFVGMAGRSGRQRGRRAIAVVAAADGARRRRRVLGRRQTRCQPPRHDRGSG
jgi:hypothetical protein